MSNNKYIQLCYDERIVIENRLKNGESYTAIAKSLGRSTSTISREVNSFIEDRLLTHTERKSGLGSISLVIGYNATGITKQTKVDIERVFGKSNVATITYDNGVEFSSWRTTEKTLDVDIYFADPYKSSQRGRNENFNGLIRDFYPKGTDFKKLTAQCILDLENILNNRPRTIRCCRV